MAKNQASLRIYLVDGSMRFIDMCRAYKRKWQVDRMLKKVQPPKVEAVKQEVKEEGYNSDPNPASNVTKASAKQAPSWEADIDKILEEKKDKRSKERQWKKVAANLIADVLGEGTAASEYGVSEGRHVVAAAHASGAAGALTLDPLSPLHFRHSNSNRNSLNGGTAAAEKRISLSGALQQMGGDIRARAAPNITSPSEVREGIVSPRGPATITPMNSGHIMSPDTYYDRSSHGGAGRSLLAEPLPNLNSQRGLAALPFKRSMSPPRLSPIHVDHSKRVDIASLLGKGDKTWNPPPRGSEGPAKGDGMQEGGSGLGVRASMDGELHRGKFLPALGGQARDRSNGGEGSILDNALPPLRSRSPLGDRVRASKGGDEGGLADDGRRSEPRKRPSPLGVF